MTRALLFLVDLVVFALWDRAWVLRPLAINLALRLDVRHCDLFRGRYYHFAMATASPRAWRWLASRRPDILFLWRMDRAAKSIAEHA